MLHLFQCQPNQSFRLICHEQRDIQHIIVQFQIVQRESDAEFNLIMEQFLELLHAKPLLTIYRNNMLWHNTNDILTE